MKPPIRYYTDFLRITCLTLLSFSLPCISFDKSESSNSVSNDPWIKPFLFNAAKVTRDTLIKSPKKQRARFRLLYKNDPYIGQKLFPQLDSAAKAEGWIESNLTARMNHVESMTYWKKWNGESGITGEYNITFHLTNWSCVIIDWHVTPADKITKCIQNLHDSRLDDPAHKDTKRVSDLHFIARYFTYIPPGHRLYPLLSREFEYLLL